MTNAEWFHTKEDPQFTREEFLKVVKILAWLNYHKVEVKHG